MADVEFETDNQFKIPMSTAVGFKTAENKMAEWLMRKGVAKSQNQAQYILLGMAGAAIAIAIVAWFIINPSQSRNETNIHLEQQATPPRTPANRF